MRRHPNDPEPLAILIGSRRQAQYIARAWAKANPQLAGYLVVTEDRLLFEIGVVGGAFYQVHGGTAVASSAIDCLPNYFAEQERG